MVPPVGIVDDLIRDGKDTGGEAASDTADGGQADNPLRAAGSKSPNVCAVTDPVGRDTVTNPMPGKKQALGIAETAPCDRRRGRAKGGLGPLMVDDFQPPHDGKTGAPDKGQPTHNSAPGRIPQRPEELPPETKKNRHPKPAPASMKADMPS
jgi:hypothetical protein